MNPTVPIEININQIFSLIRDTTMETGNKATTAIDLGNSQNNPLCLYQKLRSLDNASVYHLYQKIHHHLTVKRTFCRATLEDTEELTNDAVLIVLQKIMDGSYQFQGFNPVTFARIVADNLLRNFCRKKRIYCHALEEVDMPHEPEVDTYFAQKELELKIGKALSQLSPEAQKVIRLKYYEELTDTEVIEQKLTIYSTVDSLKNRRCQYLKELAKTIQLQQHTFS